MVSNTVAFNATNKTSGSILVEHTKVYAVTCDTHLRDQRDSTPRQFVQHILFEQRIGVRLPGGNHTLEVATFCILQELTKQSRTRRTCRSRIDVVTSDGGKHSHAISCAGGEDVEAAPTILSVEWAEVVAKLPIVCFRISNTQEDHVSFVTLNILEILYKERLVNASHKKRIDTWIVAPALFEFVLNSQLLSQIECPNSQRLHLLSAFFTLELFFRKHHDRIRNASRLNLI